MNNPVSRFSNLRLRGAELWLWWLRVSRDAAHLSVTIFKILAPVIVVVKILQELDAIRYAAMPLGPVMKIVGLPAEMGLVWATAMLNTLYSAIVVLTALVRDNPISQAQATVLCTMMLVAHSLPIELQIARKCGARVLFQAVSRISCALLLGWILHTVYSHTGLLQEPALILVPAGTEAASQNQSLLVWALGEIQKLFYIFLIIYGVLLVMELLRKLKVTRAMEWALRPVLGLMGIGSKASSITVVGLTMGLAYGGGLIIHESRLGHIDRKDVFYSVTLMGLSHGLIEDTLLMMLAGGRLSGLLCARLAFSLIVVSLFVRLCSRLSQPVCNAVLWSGAQERCTPP